MFKDEMHPWLVETDEAKAAHLLMDDYQIPRTNQQGFEYLLYERILKALDNVRHGRY